MIFHFHMDVMISEKIHNSFKPDLNRLLEKFVALCCQDLWEIPKCHNYVLQTRKLRRWLDSLSTFQVVGTKELKDPNFLKLVENVQDLKDEVDACFMNS